MAQSKKKLIQFPFSGTMNTVKAKGAFKSGEFSDKKNIRNKGDGFKQRTGQKRLHTTTNKSSYICQNIYQHKDKAGTRTTYIQWSDGSVHKATNNPPTATTGNYGTAVVAAIASSLPATWSELDDNLLFSDGVRQHQIYTGDQQEVSAFIVYKGGAAIPTMPEIGEDYTVEVGDDSTSRVAILSSLNTLVNYDTIYVITQVPCVKLNFTMVLANGTEATSAVQYYNGGYTPVSNLSDGTETGDNTTFGKTGSMTWDRTSDEIPHTQFGVTGFVYRISVGTQIDSSVTVSRVTYSSSHSLITSDYQNIVNVWDGFPDTAIEAQVFNNTSLGYESYGGGSVPLTNIFGDASDYVYFNSLDRIWGFYAYMGATPNVVRVSVTGTDISFHDGGTDDTDDYIQRGTGDFVAEGFEAGMAVVVDSTSNTNDGTYTVSRVSSTRLHFAPNTLASDESASTAGSTSLTYDATSTTVSNVDVWDGDSWATATSLIDGTSGLSKSGYVTFARPTTAQKSQFNQSGYYSYWFRFKCSAKTSASAVISIQTMPYFDINDMGIYGRINATWKERSIVTFSRYPSWLHIGATGKPMTFNGTDYAPIQAGDGRSNPVIATAPFHNELLAWQEEKGVEGGTLTLIEGYDPKTFGKLIISSKIGIVNSKAWAVVDGIYTSTQTDEDIKTICYFISRYGVMMTDGRTVTSISDDIQNYFDSTQAECIRDGYEAQHFLSYDSMYGVLRIGLCSGSSATIANVFLAYDTAKTEWGFDTLGVNLSCLTEVDASSGDVEVLQIGGGQDGFVYQTNTGTDDYSSTGASASTSGTLTFATTTTITRSSGNFTTDGWVAGMGAKISGSATNDTGQGIVERVTTVAATTLTFSDATFSTGAAEDDATLISKIPIDFSCTKELNGEGYKIDLKATWLMQKVQSVGNITIDIARNGNASFDSNLNDTRSMTATNSGETVKRSKIVDNQQAGQFSVRFRNNTASQSPHLISTAWDLEISDAE